MSTYQIPEKSPESQNIPKATQENDYVWSIRSKNLSSWLI